MATVRVEEAYYERDETIDVKGNVTEVEIPYLVFGLSDESAALAAARPKVKTISGLEVPHFFRGWRRLPENRAVSGCSRHYRHRGISRAHSTLRRFRRRIQRLARRLVALDALPGGTRRIAWWH